MYIIDTVKQLKCLRTNRCFIYLMPVNSGKTFKTATVDANKLASRKLPISVQTSSAAISNVTIYFPPIASDDTGQYTADAQVLQHTDPIKPPQHSGCYENCEHNPASKTDSYTSTVTTSQTYTAQHVIYSSSECWHN